MLLMFLWFLLLMRLVSIWVLLLCSCSEVLVMCELMW